MFRLPRPNSTIFRMTLASALLAWAALAFGTTPRGEANYAMAAPSHGQAARATMHCHAMTTAASPSHGAPAPLVPEGHGDCCHTACHCLGASAAIMNVPWVFAAFVPSGERESAGRSAPVPPASAAPPLRPPIA